MRSPLASGLAVFALLYGAGTTARSQTIVHGIHEPPPVAAAAPAPAPADVQPDAAETTVETVTVEAKRLTRPEVERQSLRFVQTYATPTAKLDQFARWREPICVQIVSPDPLEAARITARIGEVAKTLGVRVQRAGCSANIEIVYADGPQRWLDWVAEHRDAILGFHYVADTEELKKVTRPIQAWYETATRGDTAHNAGLAFAVGSGRGLVGASTEDETIDNVAGASPAGCADSRFSSCLQSVFKNVLIFVDQGRAKDHDLGVEADYLAMLALSQPRSLDGCAAFASVIDLLATRCPGRIAPDGLTPADTAYLKALYEADLEARRMSEEVDIANRMANTLVKVRAR